MNGTALSVRDYRAGDREALLELWQACDLLRPWNDPDADIARCLATPGSALLVGELDGRPGLAGSVMLGSDGHRGWLYYLAVDPGLRRRGLGRALVRRAEAWLGETGVGKVMLMLRPENDQVAAFYASLGYAVEERVLMAHWLGGEAPH